PGGAAVAPAALTFTAPSPARAGNCHMSSSTETEPQSGADHVIAVDLGGTKMEAVLARRFVAGRSPALPVEVLSRRRIPPPAAEGYAARTAATAGIIEETARSAGLDPRAVPVGVGMPGGTTRRGGLAKNANTVCINGRPFRADLERRLGRPIALDNDANCFA